MKGEPGSHLAGGTTIRDDSRRRVRELLARSGVGLTDVGDLAALVEESVWIPLTRKGAPVTIDYGGQRRDVATGVLLAGRETEYQQRLSQQAERVIAITATLEADLRCIQEILSARLTMVSMLRLLELLLACREAPPGAFVECGVGQGGCLAIMQWVARGDRPVWGFDSFEGMPELGTDDHGEGRAWVGHRCGPAGGAAEVREQITVFAPTTERLEIVTGWVEQTLPKYVADIGPIGLLRLDVDWFAATTTCLELLYDQVVPGGVVILDDYGAFAGCHKAVDRYRRLHGIDAPLVWEDHDAVHWVVPARSLRGA